MNNRNQLRTIELLESRCCLSATPQLGLAGDLDCSGVVDMADFELLRADFGNAVDGNRDPDGSGMVDFGDYLAIAANFGQRSAILQDQANLRQLVRASLNHESAERHLPSSPILTADGTPGLSWRVRLLPHLGQQELYDQFQLDEPWNSPHNIQLLDRMPESFRSVESIDSTMTRFRLLDGHDTAFARASENGTRLRWFLDGPQNSLWIVQSGPEMAVPWTQPGGLPFDADNAWRSIGYGDGGRMNVSTADGIVSTLSTDTTNEELSALSTIGTSRDDVASAELLDAASIFVRENGDSQTATEKLQAISRAFLDFESINGFLPKNFWGDEIIRRRVAEAPTLSWRVAILPYIGHVQLYDQFNLDEPWDSERNLSLLPHMPNVFRAVDDPWNSTESRVLSFFGDNAVQSDSGRIVRLRALDMPESVPVVAHVSTGASVPWTKPTDINVAQPEWQNEPGPETTFGFADGHVETQNPEQLRFQVDR